MLWQYLRDLQFILLLIAVVWTAGVMARAEHGQAEVALLVGANLAVNLIFFMTHPSIHALLYDSRRHAFVVDTAVRDARPACGGSRVSGSRTAGQSLIE